MVLTLIIILGTILRAANLEKAAALNYDQEVAAFWLKNLLVDHKFSLIGQEISVGGVYIAPFFYYLMAPFYAVFNLNPLAGNVFVTLVSILSIIAIYILGKQVFSTSVGLISSFLYAIHPGIIAYDKTVAPSNLIVLLSAALALVLTKKVRSLKDYVIIGMLLGLSFSVHPTAVLLVAIAVIYVEKKFLPVIFLIIFVFVSPLLIFDLRHDWLNIANTLKLFSFSQTGDFIGRVKESAGLWLIYWAGIIVSSDMVFIKYPLMGLAIVVWFKAKSFFKIWTVIPLIFILFYPRHVPEYYLLILTPIVLVYTLGFLNEKMRVLILVLGIFFAVKNINFSDNPTGLYYKTQAVNSIPKDRPVTVYFSNDLGQNWGFSYLFWRQNVNLSADSTDKYLIVIPASREPQTRGDLFGAVKVAKIN